MQFTKATKKAARLRLALIGPAGSGKTYTALMVARELGQRVAVIDTERSSASKYADLFDFDALNLDTFAPQTYVQAIEAAGKAGYDVLVIDSLTHAWSGKEGALEQVDKAQARSQSKNSFAAWRDVTPAHNAMVDAILRCPCHVITTMRVKTEYVMEKDERTGRTTPRKVGLAPVQRDGMEYEFDVVGDIDIDHQLIVTKTRCPALTDAVMKKPGKELALTLKEWLQGEPADPPPAPPVVAAKPSTNGVPTTGIELWERVCKQSVALAKSGKAGGGEFEAFVLDFAAKAGHGDDPGAWKTEAVRLIYEAAKGWAMSK